MNELNEILYENNNEILINKLEKMLNGGNSESGIILGDIYLNGKYINYNIIEE